MWERSVDICITTYNRNHRLVEILNALSNQSNQSFNVIVNDDGSNSLIDPNHYPIVTKYIWNKDDGYHRVARFNESVSLCVSPYIILLDDDCVPSDEFFIQNHIDVLNKHEVSQGSVCFGNNKFASGWFSTANIGLRRSLVHRVGLFDVKYDGFYGGEDIDLGIKLKNFGIEIFENKLAQVNHGDATYMDGDRGPEVVGHAEVIFLRKHGLILNRKKNIFSRVWKRVRFGLKDVGRFLRVIKN